MNDKTMIKRRSLLGYSCLFLASCSVITRNSTETFNNSNNGKSDRLPETLNFAVTDEDGLEGLKKNYESFRQALEAVLETTIKFFPVNTLLESVPAMLNGELDLAWAGPSEFLILQARAKAVPVLSIERPDFKTVIAVRADSGIKSTKSLKGKSIDIGKIGSTSSHLGAVQILIDAGLDPQADIQTISSESYSLQSLKNGEVDAIAMASHRYEKQIQEQGLAIGDYPAIAIGNVLPGDMFVASDRLDEGVVQTIRSRMLDNREQLMQTIFDAPNLAKKFKDAFLKPVNTDDYKAFREVYRAIGQESLIQ